MVKQALDIIMKLADEIEKSWDEKLEERSANGDVLAINICNEHIESGVYEELKRRYDKAGWNLSIPPKEERFNWSPYDSCQVYFNLKKPKQ